MIKTVRVIHAEPAQIFSKRRVTEFHLQCHYFAEQSRDIILYMQMTRLHFVCVAVEYV